MTRILIGLETNKGLAEESVDVLVIVRGINLQV
jgi:hypothetical protein